MSIIDELWALEILDSRGRPTVKCTCRLASGAVASASVPSGASTGSAEALELRDREAKRYGGLGCRNAVANVCGELRAALVGREFDTQAELDSAMLALDGTPNKSRLGANAILAVSIAFARACAVDRGVPLFRHFAEILGGTTPRLPRLTINLFSGGKHAGKQVAIQDVLLVPTATTIDESLSVVYAVYQAAANLTLERYEMRLLRADEGGLAPPFETAEAMLGAAVESIRTAGFAPGREVALAVDVAATHFFADGQYTIDGHALDASEMIARLQGWLDMYPIVSIEDGLAEEDWGNWPRLMGAVGGGNPSLTLPTRNDAEPSLTLRAGNDPEPSLALRAGNGTDPSLALRAGNDVGPSLALRTGGGLIMGDDFLCTNPARIRRAIDANAANALLLKVNQIGTLTEAAEACRLARSAGWSVTVSARSGETEDDWLADLAVGWAGDFIKIGSITQSERLAKYNRLLEIEAEARLPLAPT